MDGEAKAALFGGESLIVFARIYISRVLIFFVGKIKEKFNEIFNCYYISRFLARGETTLT